MSPSRRIGILLTFVSTLIALPAVPLAAQVNVEALRRDDPPLGRSGSVQGDFVARTGNVSFIAVDVQARMYNVSEGQTRLLVADGGLGFLDRARFSSSGLLHWRTGYTSVNAWVTPEWYAQINYDRPRLLAFRMVAGGGGRVSFARGAWGQFGAGSGFMAEQEWLSLPDTAAHPPRTFEVRWSSFVTLRIVASESTVITSTTYIQPALNDFGDARALENLRLGTSITERLALTVSWDLRWDSNPPDGIASLDTSLRTGVTYTY